MIWGYRYFLETPKKHQPLDCHLRLFHAFSPLLQTIEWRGLVMAGTWRLSKFIRPPKKNPVAFQLKNHADHVQSIFWGEVPSRYSTKAMVMHLKFFRCFLFVTNKSEVPTALSE